MGKVAGDFLVLERDRNELYRLRSFVILYGDGVLC